MHVYGMGDSKFPLPMNLERAVESGYPISIEEADGIYIKDLIYYIQQMVLYKTGVFLIYLHSLRM